MGCESVEWLQQAQVEVQWRCVVNTGKVLRITEMAGYDLTS
jgi:hypothetical protein